MKFNEDKPSYIVALNQKTKEADIAMIRVFYKGEITELVGYWEGKEELSYQISATIEDEVFMERILRLCGQEAYICINKERRAYMFYLGASKPQKFLGTMSKIDTKEECCTYCPETGNHWRAKL